MAPPLPGASGPSNTKIALFFRFVRAPSWQVGASLAAAGVDLAFVHPTYALFVGIPLLGFALARALVVGGDARWSAGGLVAFGTHSNLAELMERLEPFMTVASYASVAGGRKCKVILS